MQSIHTLRLSPLYYVFLSDTSIIQAVAMRLHTYPLILTDGSFSTVVGVQTVLNYELFAPHTEREIVLNSILASTYIAAVNPRIIFV